MKVKLTEEDGHEGGRFQKLFEHLEVDGFDGVVQLPVVVVQEPGQHGRLVLQISWKWNGLKNEGHIDLKPATFNIGFLCGYGHLAFI